MYSIISNKNKKRTLEQFNNSEKYQYKKQKIPSEKDLEIIELKRTIDILQNKIYYLEKHLKTQQLMLSKNILINDNNNTNNNDNNNINFYSSYIS